MPRCYNFISNIWSMPFQWKHNQFNFLIIFPVDTLICTLLLSLLDPCIKCAATIAFSTSMVIIFDLPTNFRSLTWWRWLLNRDNKPAGLGCSQGIILDINYHLDCLVDMLWKVYESFWGPKHQHLTTIFTQNPFVVCWFYCNT